MSYDVSWWAEELKLYNALIVCLCVSYTFVQGGHVRVDLIYSVVSYRVKRMIDMFGSLVFMLPAALLTYFYGWFFFWRTMVTPKLSASDTLKDIDKLLPKARALRWNVETIGFSPNGFNAYFLFKVLLVTFTILVTLQAGLDGVEVGLIIVFLTLFAGILSGFPVAFAISGSAVISFAIIAALDSGGLLTHFAVDKNSAGQSIETLLAVLMFVMMGIVLERSRIADELLTTMAKVFGWCDCGIGHIGPDYPAIDCDRAVGHIGG